MDHKIIFIGYMGCGKSTLAEKLAKEMKVPFIDSDKVIEEIANMSIAAIFKEKGEETFREMESMFIQSLANVPAFVLSTGGGMPCFNNNMLLLNELGVTVYLKNTREVLADRLLKGKNARPLIEGKSKEELIQFIDDNLLQREKFYSLAKVTVENKMQEIVPILKLIQEVKN